MNRMGVPAKWSSQFSPETHRGALCVIFKLLRTDPAEMTMAPDRIVE